MGKGDILIISSRPPAHSAGLGQDIMDSFQKEGYGVDFLTLYGYKGMPENVMAASKVPFAKRLRKGLEDMHLIDAAIGIKRLIYGMLGKDMNSLPYRDGVYLMYRDESKPPIDSRLVTDKIKKTYRAVVFLFWQDMLNSLTIRKVYEKLGCPILIYSPDMAPMTGGCYYFNTCRNFTRGCGSCPVLGAQDASDVTYRNWKLKKENYEASDCYFLGNSWMNGFAKASRMFPESRIVKTGIIIDENKFCPGDMSKSRKILGIPQDKDFVILLRSFTSERKGNSYIAGAIKKFISTLPEKEKRRVCVISIGVSHFKETYSDLGCDVIHLGFLNAGNLVEAYRASDVFLSASTDDAGPSMVNQALMCSTPVISFATGCALDVVIDGVSGYKTRLRDIEAYAEGLRRIHSMTQEQRTAMRNDCRRIALENNSSKAFIETISPLIAR